MLEQYLMGKTINWGTVTGLSFIRAAKQVFLIGLVQVVPPHFDQFSYVLGQRNTTLMGIPTASDRGTVFERT